MIEPNLGIMTYCSICGKRFWCTDGYTICSSACDNELQRIQENEEDE
ncbi:MAG TPA: hypothetical protein VFF20_08325 [Pseudogracilibacillus sp.]|nr:hypothetical protein [Pseudogracilibacillus sp.]